FVVGDPVRLRAALENLIDNAVKFTEQGAVTLTATPLQSPKGKVGVAFAISDSGIGLTLSEIKRLFRPFSQANVSIASRFGGAGLNAILTELGHQAEFIGQGEAAPERIAQGTFDAVLMDMVLPGINGVEAIRRIRALDPPLGRIAIIGVSGRGEDEAASRAAGADAFLVKPVSPRALATALHEATSRAAVAT